VSYVSAFTLGRPLFVRLRRTLSLAASSLFAAVAVGSIAGVLLVTLALLSVSVAKFIANPSVVVTFIGIGALWGAGVAEKKSILCALPPNRHIDRSK
jgi:hypothetical protein